MIDKDRHQINMTYEYLARAVFKCKIYEGPYNCAHQSMYGRAFVPEPNRLGRLIIKCMIDKLITDNENNNDFIDLLLEQRHKMSNARMQEEVVEVIEDMVDLLNNNGY